MMRQIFFLWDQSDMENIVHSVMSASATSAFYVVAEMMSLCICGNIAHLLLLLLAFGQL